MTYKATQKTNDFLSRSGSEATKPSRRGIIRDLPSWAREPEEYYNAALEQFEMLLAHIHESRERVMWLRKQLKLTLPYTQYKQLQDELDVAGPELANMEQKCGELRVLTRAAALNAWGTVFYFLARNTLPRDVFVKLNKDTQEVLQRKHQEVQKSHAERTGAHKDMRNMQRKLSKRRERFRDYIERKTQ